MPDKTHIKISIMCHHNSILAEFHKLRQNLMNHRRIQYHIVRDMSQLLNLIWNWYFWIDKSRKTFCNGTIYHFYSTNLNNFIFGCTESCCFQIKYNKTICKGLPHRVFYQPFQIVHQIGFHTINDFKIIILSNCVVCIRKSLYISVIGDSKCFVSPFHGTFDDIFDIRYTVHIAHLRMAMQFHTFHRTGIHTGRHKGRNLLDTDDRTDGQFAVKPVNCCHTFDFQKCTFRNPSVFDFLEIFILAEHFYHDRVGKICNRKH